MSELLEALIRQRKQAGDPTTRTYLAQIVDLSQSRSTDPETQASYPAEHQQRGI